MSDGLCDLVLGCISLIIFYFFPLCSISVVLAFLKGGEEAKLLHYDALFFAGRATQVD